MQHRSYPRMWVGHGCTLIFHDEGGWAASTPVGQLHPVLEGDAQMDFDALYEAQEACEEFVRARRRVP